MSEARFLFDEASSAGGERGQSLMTRRHARAWLRRAVALLTGVLAGCATSGGGQPNHVTGLITPEHFQFKTITRKRAGREPSGWRAVCIHARITHGNTKATAVCDFETGIPFRSEREGDIALEYAQQQAAARANQAAYEVLSQARQGEMLAVLCLQFRRRYQELLRLDIAPATVGACTLKELTPVIFDLPTSPLPSPL